MTLIFTKRPGKYDLMELHRPDGRVERVDCPKQGIIPHEMVHYAVEHTLALRGFLSRVLAGESAAYLMPPDAQSEGVERLVEVVQGDAWSGGGGSAEDLLEMYRLSCGARGCAPLPVDGVAIDMVRAALADLDRAWAAVAVGGCLQLPH